MPKRKQTTIETENAVKFVRGEASRRILHYRVRGVSEEELIREAKRQQEWVNRRIAALEKAGVPKNVSVGNTKRQSPAGIKTRAQAERAIARAKKIAANPLSDVRNYRALIKEAEREYGKGRRWKVVADPTNPRRPKAVPVGTLGYNGESTKNFVDFGELISDFWKWYEQIGQLFFDSNEAFRLLNEALETGNDPIEYAEEHGIRTQGADIWEEYENEYIDSQSGIL